MPLRTRITERWVLRLALVVLPAFSAAVGVLAATGNVRFLSIALLLVLAPACATLRPTSALTIVLAISPLPLFMQGINASLLVPAIVGVLLLALFANEGAGSPTPMGSRFVVPVTAVAVTALVAWSRGSAERADADLSAIGNLVIGIVFFSVCVMTLHTTSRVRSAFAAMVAGGYIVFFITVAQYFSVGVPGLLSASAGTVQSGDPLLGRLGGNLRIGGPFADYEILAEFLALVGTIALQLGLNSSGRMRVACLAFVPIASLGIVMTSTRSGLIVLAVGIAAVSISRRPARRVPVVFALVAGTVVVLMPLISIIQHQVGSAFLFQRFGTSQSGSSGILGLIDRDRVWGRFLDNPPDGLDLLLGQGPAFDLHRYTTYPHSLPIALAFTVGIAGMVAFAVLVTAIAWRCLKRWRAERNEFAYLGLVVVGLFLLNETKVEYIRVFNYQWFVWGLLGVCAAASRTPLRS